MLRLRLYDILCRLPPSTYEGAYKNLFRELVAEFTLTGYSHLSSILSAMIILVSRIDVVLRPIAWRSVR